MPDGSLRLTFIPSKFMHFVMNIDTRSALLKEAEILIRTRGYAAFSYADLAGKVLVRKASIHHHFPTKEMLGVALIEDYVGRFLDRLAVIERDHDGAAARLRAFSRLFFDDLAGGLLPLCGALSAESASLPDSMKARMRDIFRTHIDWLGRIVREGIAAGELRADIDPARAAHLVLSALEGASFVGWALEETAPAESAFEDALASLR